MKLTLLKMMLMSIVLLSLGNLASAQTAPPLVYSVENTGADYPAPPLPAVADLPVIVPFPDPFAWANDPLGTTRSTAFSDWSHHRAEIKAQIEHYEIGLKPAVDPSQISASFSADSILTVVVTVDGRTLTLTSRITIPAGEGPFPVVIGMNGNSLPAAAFTSRNIARMTFSANQVTTYGNPQNSDPYYQLYPDQNIDNSGQYAAWSWGVSRLIDGLYLTRDANKMDLDHIAVTGCSYAGKMALFSGAFDERVALTIPQESGGGGATNWRYSFTQSGVEGLSQTDHNWFRESMFTDFGGNNVSKLPEDHHMLCAMVAPRALYVTGNTDYVWLSNQSCYVNSRAVQEIYNTLGIGDRFGFCVNGNHGHCAFPASQDAELAYFLDKFMLGNETPGQTIETYPDAFKVVDYERWYKWWGSDEAVLPPEQEVDVDGIWLEAECGVVGSGWTLETDPLASNGKYIVYLDPNFLTASTDPQHIAVYNFTIESAGSYKIFARLNCPTADDDSYFVKVNNGNYATVNNIVTDGWQWVQFATSNLAAGDHKFTVCYRENGAKFDKLLITNSEIPPKGAGKDATNCPVPPLVYDKENTGEGCATPPLPPVGELPSIVRLPNPFEWSDGHGVINTLEDWSCRRNEIKLEIENYEIGFRPTRPENITAVYTPDSVYYSRELNWSTIDLTDPEWYLHLTDDNYTSVEHKANFLAITIVENGKTLTLSSTINIPEGTGPFPAVIGISGATGSLPAALFANCIQINYDPGQVAVDGQANTGAFYNLYGIQAGHYSAWSWGVSRIIDGLELMQSQMNIDLARIGITGCSRYGKLALFGGAFDERIALTIAQEPGGGGAAAWRVSESIGNVEKIDNTDYSWFMSSMRDNFKGKTDLLPHDHHELVAMIAPRALLVLGNATIDWLADPSGYVSCMAAREVWKKFDVEDRMGFDFTGGHDHCNAPASQTDAADKFIKRFLYNDNTANTNILTSPFQNVNYQFWIKDWADVTEPDAEAEQNFFEAESKTCVTLDDGLTVQEDTNASDGKYVTNLSDATVLSYATVQFTAKSNRSFNIYLRVNSDNAGAPFQIKIDEKTPVTYEAPNTNGNWQWVKVLSPDIVAGAHTLKIAIPVGAKLDRINITNTTGAPEGLGGEENECIPVPKYFTFDFETGNIDGWEKRNPGAGIDITQEDNHTAGGQYALKMVNGSSTSAWSIQAVTPPVNMVSGHVYNVTFWVRAVGGGGRGRISTTGSGQLGGTYWADFNAGDEWRQITYTNLTANGTTVQLAFDMGYVANKTYYIDDIVFDDTNITSIPKVNKELSDVKVFSPAAGKIRVVADKNAKVTVVDLVGRIVGTHILSVSPAELNSQPGIYIVNIKTGNKTCTQKVIVR